MIEKLPWTEIGIGGVIAIGLVAIVLAFVLKLKQMEKDKKDETKVLSCIENPKVEQALFNNQLSAKNIEKLAVDIGAMKDHSIIQTGYLKQITEAIKEQSATLREIARNGKKG